MAEERESHLKHRSKKILLSEDDSIISCRVVASIAMLQDGTERNSVEQNSSSHVLRGARKFRLDVERGADLLYTDLAMGSDELTTGTSCLRDKRCPTRTDNPSS